MLTWKQVSKFTTKTDDGKFSITRTPGNVKTGMDISVSFADGTRGSNVKQFFSLFTHNWGHIEQRGNYRMLAAAQLAAEKIAEEIEKKTEIETTIDPQTGEVIQVEEKRTEPAKTERTGEELFKRFAITSGVEELIAQADRADRLSHELRRYAEDIKNGVKESMNVTAADRFTWAINEIENFIRNVNFSTLARRTADLK